MKLFINIGTPESMVILVALIYVVYAWLYVVSKVNKFEKHQLAQTKLLSEIAKAQGVDESVINAINSTLD